MMKRLVIFVSTIIAAWCLSGQTRYEVTHIAPGINTPGSETGGVPVDDSVLLYTTMMNDEANRLYLVDFTPVSPR